MLGNLGFTTWTANDSRNVARDPEWQRAYNRMVTRALVQYRKDLKRAAIRAITRQPYYGEQMNGST